MHLSFEVCMWQNENVSFIFSKKLLKKNFLMIKKQTGIITQIIAYSKLGPEMLQILNFSNYF